jgi:hypothetical protein
MTDTAERPEVALRRYARAISALQAAHAPQQIYEGADGCGHPEPPEPEQLEGADAAWAAYDQWHEDHPWGEDASGYEAVQICRLSPRQPSCPACTELVYGQQGDGDTFVNASECIVLPVIGKALSEEITDD